MRSMRAIIGHALEESYRRRIFIVVLLLTVLFLGLYGWGTSEAFEDIDSLLDSIDVEDRPRVDLRIVAGATLFGLSMFVTFFLGSVLAIFLTLGIIRRDVERGLVQPIVVRPAGRTRFLLARFLAAVLVSATYVCIVYGIAVFLTWQASGWLPDRIVVPGLELALAVSVIAALSTLGSVFLGSTANGIAVFMAMGAGLVAGLLGQIGEAIRSVPLESVGRAASWALPFEALYQDALSGITADTTGPAALVVRLGPFGGAHDSGPLLWLWVTGHLTIVGLLARAAFLRRDL